jgi:hypothetical protein
MRHELTNAHPGVGDTKLSKMMQPNHQVLILTSRPYFELGACPCPWLRSAGGDALGGGGRRCINHPTPPDLVVKVSYSRQVSYSSVVTVNVGIWQCALKARTGECVGAGALRSGSRGAAPRPV